MISEQIQLANSPEELFGILSGTDKETKEKAVKLQYRNYAKLMHPDNLKYGNAEVFKKLQSLYEGALSKIKAGTYGDYKPIIPDNEIIIKAKSKAYGEHVFKLGALFKSDDISDYYYCKDGLSDDLVFKVARSPRDNDLLQRERDSLVKIHESFPVIYKPGDPEDFRFFPTLINSFQYKELSGAIRYANIFEAPHINEWVSLTDVKNAYPDGIDPKDMAWICRRLLYTLGLAHEQDILHIAPVHSNVLINPETHGLILDNWCYSIPTGTKPVLLPEAFKHWYPREYLSKDRVNVTSITDLSIVSYLMKDITFDMPSRLDMFFRGCSSADSAFHALRDFDDLIERLWGKRKFHKFEMPKINKEKVGV